MRSTVAFIRLLARRSSYSASQPERRLEVVLEGLVHGLDRGPRMSLDDTEDHVLAPAGLRVLGEVLPEPEPRVEEVGMGG